MTILPDGKQLPPFTDEINRTQLAVELRSDTLLTSAQSLYFASDYGGEHQTAGHAVYSFLIVDFNEMARCAIRQHAVRQKYFKDEPRTVEFKKLAKRQSALPEWLDAANDLRGYLLSLAVDVKVKSLFAAPHEINELPRILSEKGMGDWKQHIAEKVLRVLHFQAFISSILLRPSQKVFWMTDRDAIAEDPDHAKKLLKLWAHVAPLYSGDSQNLARRGLAIPFDITRPEDRYLNDALSYPDLAAGALQELCSGYFSEGPKSPVRSTTAAILKWLATDGSNFKKRCLRVGPFEGSGIQMSYLKLDPPKPQAPN